MKRSKVLLLAVAMVVSGRLQAAPVPDAGTLLREQQPQRQLLKRVNPEIQDNGSAPSSEDITRTVSVEQFRFEGYEGICTEAELQAIVSGTVDRSMTITELKGEIAKVTAWLKGRGWMLAKAFLPEQTLKGGVVRVVILQGKSDGAVKMGKERSVRLRDSKLEKIAGQSAADGEPIRQANLERSLLLLNDLPGIHARATIKPGSKPGTSAIDFHVSEDELVSGAVWIDNEGNHYTGAWRGNALLQLNDPLRIGDQLSMLYTRAEHQNQGFVEYRAPIGSDGLMGRLSWLGMDYRLGKALESLDYHGNSRELQAGLSYPLLRSRRSSVVVDGGYSSKHLLDRQGSTYLNDKSLKSGSLGLHGSWNDLMLGGGAMNWQVVATMGKFSDAYEEPGTAGSYAYFKAGLLRQQRLNSRWNLNLSLAAQHSFDNLATSEKFYLGGPAGVRAYPLGEGGGDEGYLFNADLQYKVFLPAIPGSLQLGAFYDAGNITINHNQFLGDVSTATGLNSYWLQGAGVKFDWLAARNFVVRGTLAHTLGGNPGRSLNGMNADGAADKSRFWLQAMFFF